MKFDAAANINGQVQMTAQLYTKDGTPYGEEMAFTVKVSEITPTVLLVIAGGLLLLVLAGIRMYAHRKRANGGAARRATTAVNPSSRVTRRRTPVPKARSRRARVRKWTVERCLSWPVGRGTMRWGFR